ncbi:hypothetical protein [Siminovitchia terrae]|nr:hypothetical protein [Siminovitchia terrae]
MKILLDLEKTITSGMVTYWNPGKRGDIQDADNIVQDDYDKRTVALTSR